MKGLELTDRKKQMIMDATRRAEQKKQGNDET
jgi:hypothetical protein